MEKTVDSYRFVEGITRRVIKSWIALEQPRQIPWTPLAKPLTECRLALVSSGGVALKSDQPFDQEGEQRNPWWGDPSYRVIPQTVTTQDIRLYHLHVDPSFAEQDLNCVLPIQPLKELERLGEIGSLAANHYSFMGYLVSADEFLEKSAPAIVQHLQAEAVDGVVLVPV